MENNTSIFEQLASSLPIEERKALLLKINKSLKLHESTEDYTRHEIPRKELEIKVKNDIESSSWFERFIIKIYSFFTGKNTVDYFLKRKLHHLKKSLISINGPSYFDPECKKLSGRLASDIYSLYVLAVPLRKFFKVIWYDTDFIESVYSTLISEMIHTKKNTIYDFVSLEEMESIFADTGDKNQI